MSSLGESHRARPNSHGVYFNFSPDAGATYPVSKDTEAAFLRALEDSPAGLEAAVVGESGMRRLAGSAGPFFLHSSVVGIARPQNY